MTIREIKAKSILRKYKKVDSWFISRYGMNLYRGCTHNCIYCDGRAEGYYVDGEFGEDVTVKVNAIEILRRELDPKRKRTPFKRSFIMIGGGVGDSYQPVEAKYQLSRRTLELMDEYNFPVHVLTKSTLVKRDIDILKKINNKNRAIVSFSFSSVNDGISAVFEPGVPSPSERLKTLAFFKNEGIACGMFLLPVIPFMTDTPKLMEKTIRKASEVGLDFIIFGGMTLKEGRQKDYFIKKYRIPPRIPLALYKDILEENDLVVVILEHIDYLLKLKGRTSPYGYAAYSISQLKEPLSFMKRQLRSIKGVGMVTEKIIKEILESKSSTYYKKLLTD
jgi:DNA repair photolyase